MSLNALRQGIHIKIGPTRFLILQKLSDNNWQLRKYRNWRVVQIHRERTARPVCPQ